MSRKRAVPRGRKSLLLEPLEPRCMLSSIALAEAPPTLFANVPQNLEGRPGGQVLAPVNVDNAEGIRGVEIHLNYNTVLLDADNNSVQAGSVWPDTDTEVLANVDDASGTIVVWAFHPEALSAGAGSLIVVRYNVSAGAPVGNTTPLDLVLVKINEEGEEEIVADPEPVAGDDPTDGLITFVADDASAVISGFVYADTNSNDQPDAFEGIPGALVTLVNTDTGATREASTNDDGKYEFTGLMAGSYEIRQRQPAAYRDGGINELSVTLAIAQNLDDQNFRELGLRPEFIYNRFLTTGVLPVGSTAWNSFVRSVNNDAEASAEASAVASEIETTIVDPVAEGADEDVEVEQFVLIKDPVEPLLQFSAASSSVVSEMRISTEAVAVEEESVNGNVAEGENTATGEDFSNGDDASVTEDLPVNEDPGINEDLSAGEESWSGEGLRPDTVIEMTVAIAALELTSEAQESEGEAELAEAISGETVACVCPVTSSSETSINTSSAAPVLIIPNQPGADSSLNRESIALTDSLVDEVLACASDEEQLTAYYSLPDELSGPQPTVDQAEDEADRRTTAIELIDLLLESFTSELWDC